MQIAGQLSAQSPALAALNGVAHLNHSGTSDGGIWWATYTPGHWDPNVRIGSQASTATPSLAAFNGFVYMTHLSAPSTSPSQSQASRAAAITSQEPT